PLFPPPNTTTHDNTTLVVILTDFETVRQAGQTRVDRQRKLLRKLTELRDKPGMRAVIQRVRSASVTIAGQTKGAIQHGLLVFVGVEEGDRPDDIEWLSGKLVRLRIFNDEQGVMNRSVQEAGGEFLVISQFTLFASTRKGNRPSYSRAARPEIAIPLYESFLRKLAEDFGKPIQTGEFGADMQVALVNDGPVSLVIDTKAGD